jgi:hypothetical protein
MPYENLFNVASSLWMALDKEKRRIATKGFLWMIMQA